MKILKYLLPLAIAFSISLLLNFLLKVKIVDKESAIHTQSPKIELKNYKDILLMGDTGIAGFPRDKNLWFSDYTHHGWRFSRLFQKNPPFLNEREVNLFLQDLEIHLQRLKTYGFNAIEIPGFIELVDFAQKPEIYANYPHYRERHFFFRNFYQKVIALSEKYQIQVFFTTDMVALSGPFVEYLKKEGIGLDVKRQELWDLYAMALEELFQNFPRLAGLMIRIGEAGKIYNQEGWDYFSELLVHEKEAVQKMLLTFLAVAQKHNRKIIFRSWAVGIGQVGKMHTVPEVYQDVLGSINSPNLIVSTKYNRGDFWTYLPLNPTLFVGSQQRIVEFQTRREFEAFTIFPNYVAPHYQMAYRKFLSQNPHIKGAWIWSHSGGPLLQGPYMFYLKEGLWQFMDLNIYATAQVVKNPNIDIQQVTRSWIAKNIGNHREVLEDMEYIFLNSHELTSSVLTFKPFAQKQAFALGQEIPTVSFCYWNIVGGNSGIFSYLYFLSKHEIDSLIAEDEKNLSKIADFKSRFIKIKNKTILSQDTKDLMEESFNYWYNLAQSLSSYRKFFLRYFQWLDGKTQKENWQKALAEFKAILKEHLKKYQKNIYFPAYNFTEALRLVDYAEKTTLTQWLARIWLILTLVFAFSFWRNQSFYLKEPLSLFWLAFFLFYLFFTGIIFTSFRGIVFSTLILVLGFIYVIGIYFLFNDTKANPAHFFVPALALGFWVTVFPAIKGGLYFWMHFWISIEVRSLFVFVLALIVLFSYPYIVQKIEKPGFDRFVLTKLALIASAQFFTLGAIFSIFGLNEVITEINNELVVLPYFLTLIHGIVKHLNIPENLPIFFMVFGLLGAVSSFVGWQMQKRKVFQKSG